MEGDNPILLIYALLHIYGSMKGRSQVTHPNMSHAQEFHRTKGLSRQSLVKLSTVHLISLRDSSPLKEHFEKTQSGIG